MDIMNTVTGAAVAVAAVLAAILSLIVNRASVRAFFAEGVGPRRRGVSWVAGIGCFALGVLAWWSVEALRDRYYPMPTEGGDVTIHGWEAGNRPTEMFSASEGFCYLSRVDSSGLGAEDDWYVTVWRNTDTNRWEIGGVGPQGRLWAEAHCWRFPWVDRPRR